MKLTPMDEFPDLGITIDRIDDVSPDADPRALMEQIIHDCPECQADRARGIQPVFLTGAELRAMVKRPPGLRPSWLGGRRPRWRTRKRGPR